jgi:hypothetical protein
VHLEEEFRLLTLQVIGEAILSLPPEECDRVSESRVALASSRRQPACVVSARLLSSS